MIKYMLNKIRRFKESFDKEYIEFLNINLVEENKSLTEALYDAKNKISIAQNEISYMHKHWRPRGGFCHMCKLINNKDN